MDNWKILIWKEWEEHKWKLLALIVIVLSVFFTLLSEDVTMLSRDAGHVIFALEYSLIAHVFFAPLFVGMGVCAAERSQRSIVFLRAQPVSMRHAATVRFVMGLCLVVVPILICYVISLVLVALWPDARADAVILSLGLPGAWSGLKVVWVSTGIALGASVNAYAWIVAAAVNQHTDFRAGLVGVVVVVLLVLIGANGGSGWDNEIHDGKVSVPYLVALISTPLSYLGMIDFARHSRSELIFFAFVWQFALSTRLAQLMIRRYGAEPWFGRWQVRRASIGSTAPKALGRPMLSPWWALFWMEMRQAAPVALVGFSVVLLTWMFLHPGADAVHWHAALGSVLALIIGVGSFVHELEPKLHTFWRSRPISPSSWFWLKFSAGFAVLVVLFDIPYVLLATFELIPYTFQAHLSRQGDASIVVTFFPVLLHLLVYCLSVLAACSIRHSIYSTVFAVCGALVILLPPLVAKGEIPRHFSLLELWDIALLSDQSAKLCFLVAATLVAVIAVPAMLLAHSLIKRNISVNA